MRRYRSDSSEFSEINITPLTDVVLVLLLIFMIASPALVSRGLPVSVPQAASADEAPEPALTLSIDGLHGLYVEERAVPFDSLDALLPGLLAGRTDAPVILRADTAARHGEVVRVLDAVQRAGGRPVLGVDRPDVVPAQ